MGREAEVYLLDAYRAGGSVERKGPIDLVTEHDLAVERQIRTSLAGAFPADAIVGEEATAVGAPGARDGAGAGRIWYVDPIDGTTNFAHGHPFFCVSIALYDGPTPEVGVIVAPALAVSWWAARGLGCYRNGARCSVSGTAALSDALCATGFPYDRWTNDDNLAEHGAFLKRAQGIRRCGSAALDLALVAEGTYDVYWEQGLSAWDMCAGAVLVLEAGGRLSDYDGAPADARTGRLVATNGRLHEQTLAVLAAARA